MSAGRAHLIRNVWPDKALYASTMLLVAGALGALSGLALMSGAVTLALALPGFVRDLAPATLGLSIAAMGLAGFALKTQKTVWAFAGAVAAILSLGFFGLSSLLGVVALGFLALAKIEGEDAPDEGPTITPDMWPDKSLAASLLSLVNGLVNLAWGGILLGGMARLGDLAVPLGAGAVVAGAASLASAHFLFRQQKPGLGMVAALLCLLTVGFGVVGPLLALGTMFLLNAASKEREFRRPRGAGKGTPPPPSKAAAAPAAPQPAPPPAPPAKGPPAKPPGAQIRKSGPPGKA